MRLADVLSYIALTCFCAASIAVGETIQITDGKFRYPFIFRYIIQVVQLLGIFIIPIWKYYRSYFNLSTNILKKDKESNIIAWFIYYCICAAIVHFVSGTICNISLNSHTITVPTSNAISGCLPVPVLILSVLFVKEKLNLWKIMAMFMAIIGVLCFVLELLSNNNYHKNETYDTYYGIILTIIWTVFMAINEIIVKQTGLYCYESDKLIIGNILFMTFQGVITLFLFFWTVFYPKKLDIISLNSNGFTWVIITSAIYFLYFFFEYVIITLKSPFYLSIASALSIPVSFVIDMFVHNYKLNIYAIFGAIFITISFLMLEILKPNTNRCPLFMFCNGEKERKLLQQTKQNDDSYDTFPCMTQIRQKHSNDQFDEFSKGLMDKTQIQ